MLDPQGIVYLLDLDQHLDLSIVGDGVVDLLTLLGPDVGGELRNHLSLVASSVLMAAFFSANA